MYSSIHNQFISTILFYYQPTIPEVQQLAWLSKYFPLKPASIGPPKLYLEGKLFNMDLPNGVVAWTIISSKFIHISLKNIEFVIKKHGLSLRKETNSSLYGSYMLECDLAPECDTRNTRLYASLVGILM